ncbi:S-layer homology domain-containing protein, partial [Candidatus Peregrinibacteria bacterium]|nr:S-layer homology domain-containing protein [Candidatus Peregrinibacteria bacterium]
MRIFTSIFISFIFVFQLSLPVLASSAHNEFYEQARGHFESEGILKSGTKKYDEQRINKAAFFKMALQNSGFTPSEKIRLVPTVYKDVSPKSWYAPYVQKAYRLGVIHKSENFYPEKSMRRIEAFKILLDLEGYNIPKIYDRRILFRDLQTSENKRIAAKVLDMGVYSPRSEKIFGAQAYIKKKE